MTRSCGCLRKDTLRKIRFNGYENISGKYWSGIRGSAKRRNLEFNITIKAAWEQFIKQNRKCALSSVDIEFNLNDKSSTASIDRINNNKGYILENIQIVHKIINRMKNSHKQEDFVEWCKKVANK